MNKNNISKNDFKTFDNGQNDEEIDFIFPDDDGDPNHKFNQHKPKLSNGFYNLNNPEDFDKNDNVDKEA